ncbi:MAG: phenylalanine--tRNA ligase subunit beta [Candidatus Magasanikbacteria bacterium]|nr:phenylalanine--tRNA ligase subunit beta [Candidatus Magasanikbacteria bacterium]NCS71828.1 phenylalanine--tRNA ligase subunit beta [Candidatus Magasanikbacteria bacterium]
MLFSKNWLSQYIDFPEDITPQTLGEELTFKVVEVEEIQSQANMLEGIVVGKVLSMEKHPDADKLNVCIVDIGEAEAVQVVCGGSNVTAGMLCAFGKIGAKVTWHGEGDLIELKPVKIRGIESSGMICAADEIGLASEFPKVSEMEIVDITNRGYSVGTSLAKALGKTDTIIDVENKTMTHRPDLWGHYGMARECAVMYGKVLKPYNPPAIIEGTQKTISVDIQAKELCPRASFIAIDNVHIEPSPAWLKERLTAVGLKPINNIVDVTNYLMYDLGQPMHAHDADKLSDGNIIIRRAKDGEQFITLDKKEMALTADMLVIADKNKAVALAGIMGGEESNIHDGTTNIILEAANFDAINIRKTAQAVGLRTDASTRFEKSLDPYMTEKALRRAVELILELCLDASVSSNFSDEFTEPTPPEPIHISLDSIQKKIGATDITAEFVTTTLQALGFTVSEKDKECSVGIPTWRATKDVAIPEDIVEEIARMYGFNNVSASLPSFPITPPPENTLRNTVNEIKKLLALEAGCTEVYNYSFISPEIIEKTGDNIDKYIELENPVAKDRPFLRRNLMSNMLENVEKNQHNYDIIRLFEIGKTFIIEEEGEYADNTCTTRLPKQDTHLAIAIAHKGDDTPFFAVSQVVHNLCQRLGIIPKIKNTKNQEHTFTHPGRTADLVVGKERIGYMSELHPSVQAALGLDERVAMCEININTLVSLLTEKTSYKPLDQFPAVERDLAIVVDTATTHKELVETISQVSPLITSVDLFDVYEGEHVEKGKKSMAYHLKYRSNKKTLEAKEVDDIHDKVVQMLGKKFGAELR